MSKKDPAFLFYPEKFINGTMFMTNEQTGKYIKLLCHEHQNGGLIDKDDFNNFVGDDKKLRAKFIETDDGFFNEKLMSEIEKRKVKSENMSVNAKIRWNEHKQKQCNCITNVDANAMQPLNKDKDINTTKDLINKYTEDFEKFWKVYPKKIGKGKAFQSWKKIRPSRELQALIIDAVIKQCESDQWKQKGGQFVPNPATWLNESRWDDEITKIEVSYGID